MLNSRISIQAAIITGIFTLFASIGGYAFNAIDKRFTSDETRIITLESTVNASRERIKALEADSINIQKSLTNIQDSLNYLIRIQIRARENANDKR